MKNFLLGVLVMLIVGGLVFAAYQYGLKSNQQENSVTSPDQIISPAVTQPIISEPKPTITPIPTLSTVNDTELIRQALFKKNNWPEDPNLVVKINTNDGKYASGSVNSQNGGGGGYLFAAKVNGVWQIVADGNGAITCTSLTAYPDFPKSLIPECWDQTTNKNVKR
jgi:hypothetical protein